MKRFLMLIVLLALPFQVTLPAEGGAAFKAGAFFKKPDKAAFGITTGTELVVVNKAESQFALTTFTGVFYANTPDDIQGASILTFARKYFQASSSIKLGLGIGTGFLYDIQDAEDKVNAASAVELTANVLNWISIGLGSAYVPQDGSDGWFPYLTLNLLSIE
jgi:hypothetical protein